MSFSDVCIHCSRTNKDKKISDVCIHRSGTNKDQNTLLNKLEKIRIFLYQIYSYFVWGGYILISKVYCTASGGAGGPYSRF